MSRAALMQKVIDETNRLIKKANKMYGLNLPEQFPIRFDIRGTSGMAGQAIGCSEIRYNLTIMELNPEEFLGRTPIHEVCHIICVALWPRARVGHGPEWKRVMAEMGAKDITRCHSMETARTDRRPWQYKIAACGCEFNLTTNRHNQIQRGAELWCKKHKNHIKPNHLVGKHTPVVVKPVVTSMPTPKRVANVNATTGGTKKEQALALMRANPNLTRGEYINLFMTKLNMGKAGASTYHQMLKTEV